MYKIQDWDQSYFIYLPKKFLSTTPSSSVIIIHPVWLCIYGEIQREKIVYSERYRKITTVKSSKVKVYFPFSRRLIVIKSKREERQRGFFLIKLPVLFFLYSNSRTLECNDIFGWIMCALFTITAMFSLQPKKTNEIWSMTFFQCVLVSNMGMYSVCVCVYTLCNNVSVSFTSFPGKIRWECRCWRWYFFHSISSHKQKDKWLESENRKKRRKVQRRLLFCKERPTKCIKSV